MSRINGAVGTARTDIARVYYTLLRCAASVTRKEMHVCVGVRAVMLLEPGLHMIGRVLIELVFRIVHRRGNLFIYFLEYAGNIILMENCGGMWNQFLNWAESERFNIKYRVNRKCRDKVRYMLAVSLNYNYIVNIIYYVKLIK